jgi:PAT family beta-lactamase induction signal transducer AmpG
MKTESHPSRLLWIMGGFGFMSGLPLPLTIFTLQQWFTTYGISLHAIGLTSWIGLSYTLKFLWSAVFDRLPPPPVRRLGRRRGWLVIVQPALTAACVALALSDPGRNATLTVLAALALAFLSASQDILIDAWRIETFPPATQAAALATYVWFYRGAMLVSDSGAIWLSVRVGWHAALLAMAGLLALGTLVTLAAPEPAAAGLPPPPRGWRAGVQAAFVAPFREFLGRAGAIQVLAFVLLFRLGKVFADGTAAGLYRYRLGFPPAAVAQANFFSIFGTLAGAAAAGLLVARVGALRALLICGALQAASLGLYLALLATGADQAMLTAKVVLEYFAGAMADTAFLTYLSMLCSKAYTATQYAMLSSLAAVALHTLGGFSGYAAELLGYHSFYIAAMLASLPALLIVFRLDRLQRQTAPLLATPQV